MSIDFNVNNLINIGEELIIQNQYVVDKDFVKDYNKECDILYNGNKYRSWIKKYNKDIISPFFIGIDNDTIEDLDKCISNEDMIICECWRDMKINGSNYYTIKKKQFNKYISLRDILEQLQNNNDLLDMKHNILNSYIILTDIIKKTNSSIHYQMYFENYY